MLCWAFKGWMTSRSSCKTVDEDGEHLSGVYRWLMGKQTTGPIAPDWGWHISLRSLFSVNQHGHGGPRLPRLLANPSPRSRVLKLPRAKLKQRTGLPQHWAVIITHHLASPVWGKSCVSVTCLDIKGTFCLIVTSFHFSLTLMSDTWYVFLSSTSVFYRRLKNSATCRLTQYCRSICLVIWFLAATLEYWALSVLYWCNGPQN